jgi:4-hydroxybenzoate polyprenyltransferase
MEPSANLLPGGTGARRQRGEVAGPFARAWRSVVAWGQLIKLSHTVFALPFALASMVVAARDRQGWPGLRVFGLVVLAVVFARTCAMSFNRIVDREFDRLNPRTASRHLPAGLIAVGSAWALCIGSAVVFVVTAHFINPVCFWLSPVALGVVCFYSLTKRFTDFTHVYLGFALALAPMGAWLAVRGELSLLPIREGALLPLLMSAAVVFWLIGFDIIYALQDYEFDRSHGLRSLVVRWGPKNALQAAFISHLVMWLLLAVFGLLCRFRLAYFVGLAIILGCLVIEHWLARRRSMKWINVAFFRLNALISVVYLAVTVGEVAFPGFRWNR